MKPNNHKGQPRKTEWLILSKTTTHPMKGEIMSKEITKAKKIVRELAQQMVIETDSLLDAYDAVEFSLQEQERRLGERCAKAEARVTELENRQNRIISAYNDKTLAPQGRLTAIGLALSEMLPA